MIPIDSEVRVPTTKPKGLLSFYDFVLSQHSQRTDSTEKPSNYTIAMDYLRKSLVDGSKVNERSKTVVDVYVEKQMEYTKAQIEWDSLQDRNAGVFTLCLDQSIEIANGI